MKTNRIPKTLFANAALLLVVVASGCRSIQGVVGDPNAKPRSVGKWHTLPQIDPVNADSTKLWIDFKDVAGAYELDFIKDEIKRAAESEGYTVTNNPDEAKFQYRVWLRFFGEDPNRDGGSKLLAGAGAIGTGLAAGTVVKSVSGNTTAGVVTGIGVGVVAGEAFTNFSKTVHWGLIVDVEIFELTEGTVKETKSSDKKADSSVVNADGQSGQVVSSQDGSTNTSTREYTKESNRYLHLARLHLDAFQTTMSREEAVTQISKSLPSMLSGMLP